jgi:hypothetical protein
MRRGRHRTREVRLTPEQAGTVLTALDDAAQVRYVKVTAWCSMCERSPGGACASHVADLALVDEFRDIAAVIRDQLPGQLPAVIP